MVIDLIVAGILALVLGVAPAYLIRYKLYRRQVGKGWTILYVILAYFLMYIAIAWHGDIAHPELESRPGLIFLYLALWWIWSVMRKPDAMRHQSLPLESYDETSDLKGVCPECNEAYSVWKNPLSNGICGNCGFKVV